MGPAEPKIGKNEIDHRGSEANTRRRAEIIIIVIVTVAVPDGEKMAEVPGVKCDGRSACNVGK